MESFFFLLCVVCPLSMRRKIIYYRQETYWPDLSFCFVVMLLYVHTFYKRLLYIHLISSIRAGTFVSLILLLLLPPIFLLSSRASFIHSFASSRSNKKKKALFVRSLPARLHVRSPLTYLCPTLDRLWMTTHHHPLDHLDDLDPSLSLSRFWV